MSFFYEYITLSKKKNFRFNSKVTSSLDEIDLNSNFEYDTLSENTDDLKSNIKENNLVLEKKYDKIKESILNNKISDNDLIIEDKSNEITHEKHKENIKNLKKNIEILNKNVLKLEKKIKVMERRYKNGVGLFGISIALFLAKNIIFN